MIMDLAACGEHNIPSSDIFRGGDLLPLLEGRNLNQLLKISYEILLFGHRRKKYSPTHECNTRKDLGVGKSTVGHPLQYLHLNCEKKIFDLL